MNPHLGQIQEHHGIKCCIMHILHPLQPPLAHLEGMFQHIDKVMDVSSRLLSIMDQAQIKPSDPQYLETLCKCYRKNQTVKFRFTMLSVQ